MDKQPKAEKDMEYPRLDHTGQNKKERPKQSDNKMRRKVSRRPGLEHPGRNKRPEPKHPGTSGSRTPRTGLSGVDQAARAAAPRTASSGDKGQPDAPDWNIRGGTGSSSHRTHDTKVEGHVGGRRPGQEHLGQNKTERTQPPGPGRDGMPPQVGMPGADQPQGVPTPRAGASRGKWRPEAKETGDRDQGGAAKETRLEATQRTGPRKSREAEKWRRSRRCRAAKMRTRPWCSSRTDLWMRPARCREAAVRIRPGYSKEAEIRTRPRRGSATIGKIKSCARARDLSRSRHAIRRQLPTKNEKLTEFNQISPSMLQWTTLRMSPCVPRYLRSWQLPWGAFRDLLHRMKI